MGRLLMFFGVFLVTVCISAEPDSTAQVEVRAVLISCVPDDGQSVPYENEGMRFEREELFKHSVLRDCKKKIALTVKITSDPDLNSGDEYIPIEHVFQGPMKRVRLLNPYVLRLKREPPLQAYKLKKIDRNTHSFDITTQNKQLQVPDSGDSGSENGLGPLIAETESSTVTEAQDSNTNLNDNINESNVLATCHKPNINKPEPYEVNTKIDWPNGDEPDSNNPVKAKRQNGEIFRDSEKDYEMYEIGNADLWYTIQVQLFEKLTTPEGRTAWNDLTKGKPARVSSLSPEWTGQDMSILYKSSEWIPRETFTLPMTSMCLLAPVSRKATATLKLDEAAGKYIVVPREDIVGLPIVGNGTNIRDDSADFSSKTSSNQSEKSARRVIIRSSRALLGDDGVKVNIVPRDGEQYLTLLHRRPYHAQIDLEARADGNQLVQVGSSGRIMTVVSDSSRQMRTVLTVQATNTGLAAARFKVVARECNPVLPEMLDEKINEEDASFILLPPKHTQTILIDMPAEIPADLAHCSVALINNDRQTVAVRDVAIKKGDRCFCVWHCECVCLSEDPKLVCREMAEARQVAAGLSPRERSRLIRSVCYHDVLSLNFCLTAFGVIVTLLFFGLVKACLGLCCRWVGWWGLSRVLQTPRKLDHYHETGLRSRSVLYDEQGWPIHPDTKERSVRLLSLSMEFLLNTIFFVMAPCVIVYEAVRHLCSHCTLSDGGSNWSLSKDASNKKCYNSRENIVQSSGGQCRRRRGARLQRWMTPEAEQLTSRVMQQGVPTHASMIRDYMRPLLCEEMCRGDTGTGVGRESGRDTGVNESCGDSEMDDTEYVLMQMQKSRDSLAKNQRKLAGSTTNK